MSERMTSVHLKGLHGGRGFANYGRIEPEHMIADLRRIATADLEAAQKILNAPDEDFIVETYVGVHVQRNREQLWPKK